MPVVTTSASHAVRLGRAPDTVILGKPPSPAHTASCQLLFFLDTIYIDGSTPSATSLCEYLTENKATQTSSASWHLLNHM